MTALATAAEHVDAVTVAALTRTPLAGIKAQTPAHFLSAAPWRMDLC